MVITFRDITKYKIMEGQLNQPISELRHQTQLMKAVFDNIYDGIVVLSLRGEVLFINPSVQQIFGAELPDTLPSQWSEPYGVFYADKETRVPMDQLLFTYISRGEAIRGEELFVRSEEKPEGIHLRVSAIPLFDENQEVVACVCVVRDILPAELETPHPFDEIVGKSQNMQRMFALMQRAAESDITVFISGQSGTGKELVARAIHANSDRKEGPFVTVNCAAIPETLIESELFGHERGAFTGATTKRIGKFEQANRGTIFFDEIGDMPLVLQPKLLRVLQERQIQRVGGMADIPVDFRVLTATNQNLEAAVEAGNFREDLFYRIATFPLVVPPLKDRCEDIPLLADHFLKKYAESMRKSINVISADAVWSLMQYGFPGNVRELESIIERAVLLETTELLQSSSLPPEILRMKLSQSILSSPGSTEILPFEEVERQVLAHALKVMDNDVTKAAQALKIGRSTLYRKLKLYQLFESD
ncbi:PAS domain-containing protein [Candidatus Poribacteria bacterium]|nr:PAS domain-containing protein [Candidatus Poribacteria bacterium]